MRNKEWAPLLRILSQQREYYPIIIIYSICVSLLTLATPISVQSLVNTFSLGPFFQPIFILSVILLGLLGLLGLLKSLQYLLVEYLQRRIYAKVTATISRANIIGGTDEIDIKEKANRYFDVILVQKTLAFLVTDGIAVFLQTVIGLFLIALYHPFFIVFGLLILVSIIFPLYLYLAKGMGSAVAESTAKYHVADYLKEIAKDNSHDPSNKEELSEADENISHYLRARSYHFKTIFTQNIIYVALYAFLNALLLGLGGYLVVSNQLTVGQLVAAEIVVNAILSHFLYAKKYLESFYDMYAASVKLNVFHDLIDTKRCDKEHKEINDVPWLRNDYMKFHEQFSAIKTVYSPRNYKKTFQRFCYGGLAVLLVLGLTPWMQTSRGYGQITAFNPNDRAQMITATVSGVIEEWLVQDGQIIRKGDPIVRVVDNDPNYLVRLEAQRDAAIKKFDAVRESSETARLNFHRQETLVKEGLSSQKEFEQSKIKYKKLLAEEAEAAASLAKAEVNLSRQQSQIISAPRDGQILRILHGSGTTNVKAGENLVQFVPKTDDNIVELFVDSNDLPLLHEGRKVRLQFEGWPSVQFSGWPSVAIGSFGGVVSVVDPSVSDNGVFRVLIKPDPEDSLRWPNQSILRQGTRAVGIIVLDQVSLGYEFWRKINGFPKSMPNAPGSLQKSVEKKK